MATASNSKANRNGRFVSGNDVSEATAHVTKMLSISLFDDETKEITTIKRYFRNADEKQDFINSMKRGK